MRREITLEFGCISALVVRRSRLVLRRREAENRAVVHHAYMRGALGKVTICRYAIYGFVVALCAVEQSSLGTVNLWWLSALGATPAVWHGIYCALPGKSAPHIYRLHMLEWCLVILMLLWAQLSLAVWCSVMFVFLAANIALWGLFWASAMVGLNAALLLAAYLLGVRPSSGYVGFAVVLAGTGSVVFALWICAVANLQARQIARRSRWHKSRQETLLRYLPTAFAGHLADVGEGGVRRVWMSVVFVDLQGFTGTARRLAAEELDLLLNDFFDAIDRHTDRWQGFVAKFLGDGALCVFVSPTASQNQATASHAVRFAAALPSELVGLCEGWRASGIQIDVGLSCGVASGFCAIGDWGSTRRWEFSVIGDPVNLAARLQSEALRYGGVLVDERTASLVDASIADLAAPVGLDLKGIGQVRGWPVLRSAC